MNKRVLCVLLCAVFLMSLALPVCAQEEEEQEYEAEIYISSVKDFLRFAEKCRLDSYSEKLKVTLRSDLDLEGAEFEGVPIFAGTFDGNGHTIRGFQITAEGSAKGLFRYLTQSAQVWNLTVEAQIQPSGSRAEVGGIAGNNRGTISGCTFRGTLSGGSYVGGIAGRNTVTGTIEDCLSEGIIQGDHFVGGIAGENVGVIRRCQNRAGINTTAQQNTVELSDITLDSIRNSESSDTVTDIGGIAGISTGVIRSCKNEETVGYRQMGYNIGGIAGTQSGYLADCTNTADVFGRKEVGGIVGQMEPTSTMFYVEDTLQILQEQLNTLSVLVSRASGNAQSNAGSIYGQLEVLRDQTESAASALESLLPSEENPGLPDADAIAAAQNALNASLNAMSGTIRNIAGAAGSTVSGLSRDMRAVQSQMSAMGETISRASEHMGGTIVDVSDEDMPELLLGKVERCTNTGNVLADRNVGGVIGAMAPENDMDLLEDWNVVGEESLNFQSEVRAVVLSCSNSGTVTAKKLNGGGIVGWQTMGLVKQCVNTGDLTEAQAEYIGGITGRGAGYIRQCSAKCLLDGKEYVGGIAGSAGIVSDCRSMVSILTDCERTGGILGCQDAAEVEEEEKDPLRGNYYLVTSRDYGGVDGISYDGAAQPAELEAFFDLEGVPEDFRWVKVTFVREDGTESVRRIRAGETLSPEHIPALPEKDGAVGSWPDVGTKGLEDVFFDQVIRAEYTFNLTTVESGELRDGKPLMLLEGSFPTDWVPELQEPEEPVELPQDRTLLESRSFSGPENGCVTRGRYRMPEGQDPERLEVYVRGAEGAWSAVPCSVDKSYLVFALEEGDDAVAVALAPEQELPWWYFAAGIAGCAGLIAAVIWGVRRKRKSAQGSQPETNDSSVT
ncbi:MAG: hypothetical protein SPI15_08405 [Candidatus Faecousia sp.]|nr:hypothetical protein [Clostridiales bacterium]MDY6180862.1 hypothetical protein [Candidatus Faecousia sp.]